MEQGGIFSLQELFAYDPDCDCEGSKMTDKKVLLVVTDENIIPIPTTKNFKKIELTPEEIEYIEECVSLHSQLKRESWDAIAKAKELKKNILKKLENVKL